MDPNKQVVNPPEVVVVPTTTVTPTQEVVNETEPTSQSEAAPESQVETPPIPSAVPAANQDVDEYGVPWKNRAMEWQRKSTELAERLPQLIEEKLSKFSQPQQQQYTYEQLEAYKLQNSSDSNIVAWAMGEQRKLESVEQRKMFEDIVGQRDRQREFEISRQRSFEYVQKTYPEAMNPNHPMAQEIKHLMTNSPELANSPRGLEAAADIAYGRYMKSQSANLQQTTQLLKREVKTLQKGQLAEGGGKRVVQSVTPSQNAIEQVRKSGTIKDASNAIGILLKAKGILQEE
jgi:succinate dehydrogenase flavin-adding protein (antitoxin of CptAB toxin-antitoxin module)